MIQNIEKNIPEETTENAKLFSKEQEIFTPGWFLNRDNEGPHKWNETNKTEYGGRR